MKYHTLLLDVDGTLLDFQKSQEHALHQAFKNHQIPLTTQLIERYEELNHILWKRYELGEIDRDTVIYTRFVQLFQEFDILEDGVAFEDEYQDLLGRGAYLLDGALELVKYLSGKYHLFVVTNGVSATQRQRLKDSGLDVFMQDIFISGELGSQKPQKEFFNACFSRMEARGMDLTDKSGLLIIGDSLSSDILGGNHAGIDTCWFNPQGQQKGPEYEVTIEIHALEELYQIL